MKMKMNLETNEKGETSSDDEEDVAQGKDGAMDYLFEPDGLKGRRLSAF